MEKCVTVEPHYQELLDLFALRIVNLATLPPAKGLSFSRLRNAFTYDWITYLGASGSTAVTAPPPLLQTVAPRTLESIVAFYVTNLSFDADPNKVTFADQLIAEPTPGTPSKTDPFLAALFADVRAAALIEGFNVFHAAVQPAVPDNPETLVSRLESLNELGILTAVLVDESVWPHAAKPSPTSSIIEEVIRSARWIGPVLLPSSSERLANVDRLVEQHALPSRLVALPASTDERVTLLRRSFVDVRGRMLTMSTGQHGVVEAVPILRASSRKEHNGSPHRDVLFVQGWHRSLHGACEFRLDNGSQRQSCPRY